MVGFPIRARGSGFILSGKGGEKMIEQARSFLLVSGLFSLFVFFYSIFIGTYHNFLTVSAIVFAGVSNLVVWSVLWKRHKSDAR